MAETIEKAIFDGCEPDDAEIHSWQVWVNSEPVSELLFQFVGDTCWIIELTTHPLHLRRGYAKQLLLALFADLPADTLIDPGLFTPDGRRWLLPILRKDPRCIRV